MKSLATFKRFAREAQQTFEDAKARVIAGLRPGDVLVDCEYCDKVFIVHDDGRRGWRCTCRPSVEQSASRPA